MFFLSAFLYVHIRTIRLSHAGQKFSEKKLFKGLQLCVEISLFEQNLDQYVAVYLVRKWTYTNAEEKAHIFFKKQKTKKRTKNEYCVNLL